MLKPRPMECKRHCLSVIIAGLLIIIAPSLHAQQNTILTITETDEDGSEKVINGSRHAVDINSRIDIRIDKDSLLASVKTNDEMSSLLDEARELERQAREAEKVLLSVDRAFKRWLETGEKESYIEEIKETANLAFELMKELDRSEREELRNYINEIFSGERSRIGVVDQYRKLFRKINEIRFSAIENRVNEIREEAKTILNEQGTYFSMGGWVVHSGESRPIPLSGFDEYPEEEFYRQDRYREVMMKLSKSHEDMLRQFENRDQLSSLSEVSGELVENFKEKAVVLESNLQTCLNNFKSESDEVFETYSEELSELRSDYILLQRQFEQYIDQLQNRIGRVTGGSEQPDSDWLSEALLSVSPLINATENMRASFIDFADSINSRAQEIDSFPENKYEAVLNNCLDQFTQVSAFNDLLSSFQSVSNVNNSELKLGEEVLKHSFDKLPASTFFSLTRTGYREPGDRVVIRLVSGQGEESPVDLEVRQMRMERILTYLKLAPGLMYARPQTDSGLGVLGSFHVAPSYSVLLKGGSRKSSFYNRLLQPGIGLNISALDFNKDNTPELGIALVGSFFMDYIQVGYGYNLNVEKGYFSLGLRLPLASMTLAADPE